MGGCCGCCNDKVVTDPIPKDWPKNIRAQNTFYINWAKDAAFKCESILVATPENSDQIVEICNWALERGWQVRPTGQRHNWSPLTIGPHTPKNPKIIIVDNRVFFNRVLSVDTKKYIVKSQPGLMLGEFLQSLEENGLGLPHTPAPYDITMGGVLSINGHGTAILSADEKAKNKPDNYGTLSNRIIAMTVVAFNSSKNKFEVRAFTNTAPEFPALQTAVGRIFMLDFTMQCVPNYYMRCRSTFDILAKDLFPEPAKGADGKYVVPGRDSVIGARFPRKSYAHYVDKFGRSEVIWFPYTQAPWLKVWNEVPESGPDVSYSRKINNSCPFGFSDHVPKFATWLIKSALGIKDDAADYQMFVEEKNNYTNTVRSGCCDGLGTCCCDCFCCCCQKTPDSFPTDDDRDLYGDDASSARSLIAASLGQALGFVVDGWGAPELAERFGQTLKAVSEFGLQTEDVWDVWGPSKNTLLYVRTSTARVTANGYVVMLPRRELQLGIWLFIDLFQKLEKSYKDRNMFPANMPLEIRVTGLDHPTIVGNTKSPWLSACTTDGVVERIMNDDPVLLWLDNLSFPGTPCASEFYAEMEEKLLAMYSEYGMLVRPEWSKGWGYTKEFGAYTSKSFMDYTRKSLPNWNAAIDVFDALDPQRTFSNPFWDTFMSKVDADGSPASPTVLQKEQANIEDAKLFPTPQGGLVPTEKQKQLLQQKSSGNNNTTSAPAAVSS